nr:uncharacterized protein LOC129273421 [Lytechinus pictus]
MADVIEFLHQKGFSDVIVKGFIDNDIDMSILPTITESDLKELGIGKTFGERRRLIMAIKSLPSPGESTSNVSCSVQPPQAPSISVANMAKYYRAPLTRPEDYDIRRILESHYKGRGVVRVLDSGKSPSAMDRRALVQVTVDYLVENGGHMLYPTMEQKQALAMAIVTQFPALKNKQHGEHGHEYLFHKGGGFLDYRLKNLRTTAARRRAYEVQGLPIQQEETMDMQSLMSENQGLDDECQLIDDTPASSYSQSNVERTQDDVDRTHNNVECTQNNVERTQNNVECTHNNVERTPNNVELTDRLKGNTLVALKQEAKDVVSVEIELIDQSSDPRPTGNNSGDRLVDMDDGIRTHLPALENQRGGDNIHVQPDSVSQSSQCIQPVGVPKMQEAHPGNSQRQSGHATCHGQVGQNLHQSVNTTCVQSQDMLETNNQKSSNQRSVDNIISRQIHGGSVYHPCSSHNHNGPQDIWNVHSNCPNQSANMSNHVEMGQSSHQFSTPNIVGSREMPSPQFSNAPPLCQRDNFHQQFEPVPFPMQAPHSSKHNGGFYHPPLLSRPEHYNIRRILESSGKGLEVLRELDQGKMPSVKNRRYLVQVTVAFLVEHGGNLLYPSMAQKEALAIAIVSQFPCTKDKLPGAKGHEYLYHKGGGFLEFRLKTLRSTAARQRASGTQKRYFPPPSVMKMQPFGYRCRSQVSDPVPNPSASDDIELLAAQPSSPTLIKVEETEDGECHGWKAEDTEELVAIKAFFKDTHLQRDEWIQGGDLSISDIIAMYPAFKDVPVMIDYDFSLKYGAESSDALSSWLQEFTKPILALARTKDTTSMILDAFGDNGDIHLCALHVLIELLPTPTGVVCKKQQKMIGKACAVTRNSTSPVFQHEQTGTDAAAYATGKPAELTQPFLLCLGPRTAPEEYYLILDNMAIPAGNSILTAFARLFKSFYVFKAPFDSRVLIFFGFFASVVYKVSKNISPQVRAFYLLLCNQGNQ